jgi:hypothetical protein
VFSNLNVRGSWMKDIEICGMTNPIAYASTVTGKSFDEVPSSALATGPGLFFGANTVTDWDTTALVAPAYSGDIQVWNSTVSGFKTGIRSTANSENFYRMHMVGCDVGFQTTANCCGGDQTVFNNCSAALRPNGIGYVLGQAANRGMVFLSPSDYWIGTWMVATDCVVTVQGGNMEFTHALTTKTNFVELWGSAPRLTMTSARVSMPTATTLVWGGYVASEQGPYGALINCLISIKPYTNLTWNAGVTNGSLSQPLLLRTGPYFAGAFQSIGGTRGWALARNTTTGADYVTWPLSDRSTFAPPEFQPTIFGAEAWDNAFGAVRELHQYGVPWIVRGTNTGAQTDPDYMEVWLAETGAGPLMHQRVILGDSTRSTSNPPPRSVTLDSATITTQTNTSLLSQYLTYYTNSITGFIPNFARGAVATATNDVPMIQTPVNITLTADETISMLIYNTAGSVKSIQVVGGGTTIKTNGSFWVTNSGCTALTIHHFGNMLTNIISYPLY